uniref:Sugar phosphate transporter domain-containing protein n=1 Tax=Rhodosorus marinus TaxID=101924 RepID=A0A7S0BNB5_9RHOD|mmetsp:Transcript_24518/g.35376  ORF Transcript_24518/g.35376 Transcript_24518/m.35376 type:complete len:313 (+) Transcript_24518:108-1046(+)
MGTLRSVIGGCYYLSSSILISTLNKSLMSSYGFRFPRLILTFQNLMTILIFSLLFPCGLVRKPSNPPWRHLAGLTFSYFMNMTASMSAMNLTSLLMFSTLRRTSSLWVLVFETWLLGKAFNLQVLLSVVVVVTGALVAGSKDFLFDFRGYMLAILANISTSLYVVLIKKSHQDSSMNSLELLALTSMLSIVPLALLSYLCGEMTDGIAYIWEGKGSKPFFCTLLASSLMGFVLNHSTYDNTSRNSPLTHTITAQMKDVFLMVISFTVFDSGFISTGTAIGSFISAFGSLLYASVKYRERQAMKDVNEGVKHA